MSHFIDKAYNYLFYSFFSVYVFLIYPWGESYYYANAKAYYFLGCIFILCLLSLSRALLRKNKIIWKWTTLGVLKIVFLCLLVFSTLHSLKVSLVGEGTEHQGLLMMMSYLLLFYFASRLTSTSTKRVIQVINIASLFAALYSILQYVHLAFLPQDEVVKSLFGQRTYSFFDNPDYFGSYLVLVMPLTCTEFLFSQERKRKVLYFLIFCIQFISLLESQTRSAWLGIAIGFLIILVWVMWMWRKLWKKVALLMLIAGLLFTFSNIASHQKDLSRAVTITNDVQKIITNKDAGSAGASRWFIWQASLPLIGNHFWLGTGPNTFQQAFYLEEPKQVTKYIGPDIYDENNDYLQIALTMGVPALLVYVLILSIIVMRGIRQVKEMDIHQQVFSIGLLAAIVGYLIQSFFNISVVSVGPYFWLILGLFVNMNRLQS